MPRSRCGPSDASRKPGATSRVVSRRPRVMHDEARPTSDGHTAGGGAMHETDGIGALGNTAAPQPGPHHRVERLLIVRPQDDADASAASSELEDLPGVVGVTLNTVTDSFDILFDPGVVSDDELEAALHHQGYDLIGWQEVRAMHSGQQRTWLLEQIGSLAGRAAP